MSFTNFVTMSLVAYCLLAFGASPVVSVCEDEAEELINAASAVYINIGMLDACFIALMKKVIEFAVKYNKPVVFDSVGAESIAIRTAIFEHITPFSAIMKAMREKYGVGWRLFDNRGD